jgi:galactokinase
MMVAEEMSLSTPQSAASIRSTAPARVNLLGEHTDYTGGLVLPMAIPFHTVATITPRTDDTYHFTSELFPDTHTLTFADSRTLTRPTHRHWFDYPIGVLHELLQLGIEPPAFTLHLSGNVPFGAGVSSSASVEVATCLAILRLSGKTLPPSELALLCQRAENKYVGSPCGIMDQFAITNAVAGHALLLNTRDLTFENIPMIAGALANTRIVVCNSMVRHSVAAGEYGQRRRESEEGQAAVLQHLPHLRDLGDATLADLESCRSLMSANAFKRCRHLVTDNARVRLAREAMLAGDPTRLGELMLAGHASERDDFQCSCEEVDFLVDTAANLPGCFGARLTGGGFGGCTVNLVALEHIEVFTHTLRTAYQQRFKLTPDIFPCEAADGAIALQKGNE